MDDVRAIVQRAVKDLSIEQSLKTYEEVWLSKIFELQEHSRSRLANSASKTEVEKDDVSDINSIVDPSLACVVVAHGFYLESIGPPLFLSAVRIYNHTCTCRFRVELYQLAFLTCALL